jgi:hypothetical protein
MATKKSGKAFSFAHLFNISASGADDDDDPNKQRADESDEDYAKRMEDDKRKQGDDESDEDYAKRMEALDDPEDEDDPEKPEKPESDKEKAARSSERVRIGRILSAPGAALNLPLAMHLAMNTDSSAKAAISMLSVAVAGQSRPAASDTGNLAARMGRVTTPNPGHGTVSGNDGSPASVAARMMASYNLTKRS